MFQRQKSSFLILLTALLTLGLIGPLAVADDSGPVARLDTSRTSITFLPEVTYERLDLTVAGPGAFYHQESFSVGSAVAFDLGDAAGDGLYKYELRVDPVLDAEQREALAAAWASGEKAEFRKLRATGKLPAPLVQSGYFAISGGAFEVDASREIIEKHTISDSVCIGDDCTPSETFGNDTLRLKEAILRVHFDDTDTTGTATDWRILVNDTSGTAGYFAIEDSSASNVPFKIEAGARNDALYVTADGDIGIGKSVPLTELHIVSDSIPAIRLEQDAAGTSQDRVWDISADHNAFSVIDDSNSSAVPFKIAAGAPSNSFYVSSSGKVGIGTSNPQFSLDVVNSSGHSEILLDSSTRAWKLRSNSVTKGFAIINEDESDAPFIIEDGSATDAIHIGVYSVGINTASPNASAALDVNGPIYQRGSSLHADYVFEPGYELESIEDHAQRMWEDRHLPAVSASVKDEDGQEYVDIGAHRRGILEELEKAHIYIEQLNGTVQKLSGEKEVMMQAISDLKAEVAKLSSRLEGGEGSPTP